MITLDIQPYCQECMNFEPVIIQRPEKLYSGDLGGSTPYVTVGDTVVGCERRKYCENIKRYLERQEAQNKAHEELMGLVKGE